MIDDNKNKDGNMKTGFKTIAIWFTVFVLAFQVVLILPVHAGSFPQRISVSTDGTQANSNSYTPSISADGRYIAYASRASNLVSGDTNGSFDIFRYDRQTGVATRVDVSSSGEQASYYSTAFYTAISSDGRYVAFFSTASNLVSGDTNYPSAPYDVFVHDCQTGETTRVNVASDGAQANATSYYYISISADGRYVAYASKATNLVSDDTNGQWDVFVHDRLNGETTRANVSSDGTQANGDTSNFAISADGRYVVFASAATNLVPGDTNGVGDAFMHDRQTGETTRLSVASDGTQSNGDSYFASAISDNGRYVAFGSLASNLAPGVAYGYNAYVRDSQTGETTFIGNSSVSPTISADGRYVTIGSYDSYVYDRQTRQITKIIRSYDGTQPDTTTVGSIISADGNYMVFASSATNLVPEDTNGIIDIFITDNPLFGAVLNQTPIANPGLAQTIPFNTTPYFDGSASSDPDGNTPLSYSWSFDSVPEGSAATIDAADTAYPSFTADKIGDYIVSLTVTDSNGLASQPATVKTTAVNVPPVASAGSDQSAFVGNIVNLSGDQSSDTNGSVLTYQWNLTTAPDDSQAALSSTNNMVTSFVPDKAGQYIVSLITNDGIVNSEISTVTINVTTYQAAATEQLNSLNNSIVAIPASTFNNANSQNALTNKINAALANINSGNYSEALTKLQSDILGKTDGCAISGAPDRNDWINSCTEQGQVYPMIIEIIGYLRHV